MLFKDIPSNDRAKQHLLKAVQNDRLSHAHLFLGEDGSSGLAMAWAFAQYLMCAEPTENDSCGRCPSCLKVLSLATLTCIGFSLLLLAKAVILLAICLFQTGDPC